MGLNGVYKFKNKISLNISCLYHLTNLTANTEDLNPLFFDAFDPEKDIKHSLNYFNPNIKLQYYKNDVRDGVTIGLGTYIYLFQKGNYNDVFTFDKINKFYSTLSLGYYIYPIKNFMAELEFVGNITEFGIPNSDKPEWEDKYWKYGLRFSVTHIFLSLPKNKAE